MYKHFKGSRQPLSDYSTAMLNIHFLLLLLQGGVKFLYSGGIHVKCCVNLCECASTQWRKIYGHAHRYWMCNNKNRNALH